MRSLLVAGRTGQLASCLAGLGRQRGMTVTCLGRPELDLADTQSVTRAVSTVEPRLIVNAAAYTAVDAAESEAPRAYAVNRDGAARLAAAAQEARIPFIHISTDYVFDGCKDSPYREDDCPSPLGVYGRSKLEGEAAVRDRCPEAIILRTSWIYSPYGHNFVRTMLRLAQSREIVRVVDDQHGCPTSAADLADGILTLEQRWRERAGEQEGGVYNLAATGEATWYEFAQAIFSGWARRGRRAPRVEAITTAQYPTPARRPANSRLDCSKIAERFGIRLPHWRQGLESCIDELAAATSERGPC